MSQHPDNELKVGTTRQAAGFTWTLYKNQFGLAWKAGPRAHNLRPFDDPKSPTAYRLEDRLVSYANFDKAAEAAVALARKRYDEAKAFIAAFDDDTAIAVDIPGDR